jgi:hypothetical protein
MKYTLTLLIAVACLISATAFGQNDTGIFLTIRCAKKSPRQTVLMTNKQVCLAPNPIILSSEFTAITDLKTEGAIVWFDMTLTLKAVQTLTKISSNLPKSTFALVVDNDIFHVFSAGELTVNRTFRFQGTTKDLMTFTDIQKKLKAKIAMQTQ